MIEQMPKAKTFWYISIFLKVHGILSYFIFYPALIIIDVG